MKFSGGYAAMNTTMWHVLSCLFDNCDWLNIYVLKLQENGRQRNLSFADTTSSHYVSDDRYASSPMGQQAGSSSSPSPSEILLVPLQHLMSANKCL